MLQGKKIILAVSGSIAAYKAALLIRLLVKEKALVKVIMSHSAATFITPLTLSTLSKNPVSIEFVKDETGEWNNHVELGLWADYMIIAPASAHTIAKCAGAICDNLLIATYLSARCPVFIAPAMDLDMYTHPGTKDNLNKLTSYGNHHIPSEFGELASGLIGEGRMAEPEQIVEFLKEYIQKQAILKGKKILITAGPTYEALDPVRFIGNHSTGKMGYAIAESLAKAGAEIQLVSGPSQLKITHPLIHIHRVVSAQEMYETAASFFETADIIILSAAVADYRPKVMENQKIKKKEQEFTLELVKTVDIAQELGKLKSPQQLIIGFALETNDEVQNAREKLKRKNMDMILLNSLNDEGAGFGHDTNKITIIEKDGHTIELPLKSKIEIASYLTQLIIEKVHPQE